MLARGGSGPWRTPHQRSKLKQYPHFLLLYTMAGFWDEQLRQLEAALQRQIASLEICVAMADKMSMVYLHGA